MNLYNISIFPLIKYLINEPRKTLEQAMALKILLGSQIKTYGQLKEAIDAGVFEFQNDFFKEAVRQKEAYILNQQGNKVTAPIYTFDTYEKSGLNQDFLENEDRFVSSRVLPYNSPLAKDTGLIDRLNGLTIADLKTLLSLYGSGAKNALEFTTASFGHAKSEQVARLINFYDAQMVRTAQTYASLDKVQGNLFHEGIRSKRYETAINAGEMVQTLSQGSEFIFGELSEEQLKDLYNKVTYPQTKRDNIVRNKFINTMASYMTYEELTDGPARKRATERFIVR